MLTAGIDIGSSTTKVIILDREKNILAGNILDTGASSRKAAERSLQLALSDANLKRENLDYIVATGYGRVDTPFADRQVTEIACHAKGAHFEFPQTRMVIDIGGQDSKVIRTETNGEVKDFIMNDKCAAGTGRFLEAISRVLEVEVEQLGELSLKAKRTLKISSMCTVFAESEVISLIAEGYHPEEIASGIHDAIIERILSSAYKLGIVDSVTVTGGVANNKGILHTLQNKLGLSINIPSQPQISGAFGAALIAQMYVASPSLRIDSRLLKFKDSL